MADRTIKPDDTNDLVLQNNDGSAKVEVNEAQTVVLTGGSTTGLTVDTSGNAEFPVSVKTDTISEKTADTGVTIDGTLIKDNAIKPASGQSLVLQEDGGAAALTIETDRDVTIEDGDLIIGTAGHGVDFSNQTTSSATGASTTSEILSHYETGSWTPNPSVGTLNVWYAQYTRVGRQVTVSAYIRGNNTTTSTVISGLPFNVSSTSNALFAGTVSQVSGLVLSGTAVVDAATGTDIVRFRVAGTQEYIGHLENIAFTLTYFV